MNSEPDLPELPSLADRLDAARRHRTSRRLGIAAGAVLLLLAGAVYVLFGSGVQVRIAPEEADKTATVRLTEGIGFVIGREIIALPGVITFEVAAPRYEQQTVQTIASSSGSTVEVMLTPLPDVYRVRLTQNLPEAEIFVSGVLAGTGRELDINLKPGTHALTVKEVSHLDVNRTLVVDGGGDVEIIEITLEPATQKIVLTSEPSGARVFVDEGFVGETPLQAELLRGQRELRFELDGYVTETRVLNIALDRPPELGTVKMARNPGRVALTTTPDGATVTVDGGYRGTAPLALNLAPDIDHVIAVARPGYAPAHRTVRVKAGQTQNVSISLEEQIGAVDVRSSPNAEVYVDGTLKGRTPLTLSLTTTTHRIELRREGYRNAASDIVPDPGLRKVISETLYTYRDAMIRDAAPAVTSADGQTLILIQPGEFDMGAPRGDPGQRANEVERRVRLTRHFYIATQETTAGAFLAYANRMRLPPQGAASGEPAVDVSWDDAARFCNWLSELDGLDPVYRFDGDAYAGFNIDADGYRLPTEAEWAWVARYDAGLSGGPKRFSWGDAMPVPQNAGNFADQTAVGVAGAVIPNYDDGVADLAPVGRYPPSPAGVHDLAGNASEWVHDYYELAALSRPVIEIDRLGPAGGRQHVIRGSSWRSASITELRLSYRDAGTEGRDDLGFRIARWLGSRTGE
jgi:formylglycine-generating enzyme required for sulfatase activity